MDGGMDYAIMGNYPVAQSLLAHFLRASKRLLPVHSSERRFTASHLQRARPTGYRE
jgi:hypothetical protein